MSCSQRFFDNYVEDLPDGSKQVNCDINNLTSIVNNECNLDDPNNCSECCDNQLERFMYGTRMGRNTVTGCKDSDMLVTAYRSLANQPYGADLLNGIETVYNACGATGNINLERHPYPDRLRQAAILPFNVNIPELNYNPSSPPPTPPTPPSPPSPPPSVCAPTCLGHTCDYWVEMNPSTPAIFPDQDPYTCPELESVHGCDCSGCQCRRSPHPSQIRSVFYNTNGFPADDYNYDCNDNVIYCGEKAEYIQWGSDKLCSRDIDEISKNTISDYSRDTDVSQMEECPTGYEAATDTSRPNGLMTAGTFPFSGWVRKCNRRTGWDCNNICGPNGC